MTLIVTTFYKKGPSPVVTDKGPIYHLIKILYFLLTLKMAYLQSSFKHKLISSSDFHKKSFNYRLQ